MISSPNDDRQPNKDISSTFIKGLTVLSAFDDDHPHLTLTQIGHITGLDRASVRRLMISLVAFGYAEKTGNHFSLLPSVLSLTGSYMRANSVGTVVQPILNKYSKDIGREISLASIADAQAVYIAKSSLADTDISFGFTVGSRLPLVQTAIGRMLLATQPHDVMIDLIQAANLREYTPNSMTSPDAIAQNVKTARNLGYAISSNEFEAGVAGLAVAVGPILDAKTVIGISTPVAEMADSALREQLLSSLQHCANDIYRTQKGA